MACSRLSMTPHSESADVTRRLCDWRASRRAVTRAGVAAAVGLFGLGGVRASVGRVTRVLCSFAAGGIADRLCRVFADEAGKLSGHPWIVVNLPGAGGLLAAREAAQSPADGRTILLGPTGLFRASLVQRSLLSGFDPLARLSAFVMFGSMPLGLLVAGSHPAENALQLLEQLRKAGQPLTFATAGHGSTSHVMGAHMARVAGIEAIHVAYSGSVAVAQALSGGHVPSAILDFMPVEALLQQRRLKSLAVSLPVDSNSLPRVATLREQGLSDYDFSSWQGLFLPAAASAGVQDHVQTLFARVLGTEAFRLVLRAGYIQGEVLWVERARQYIMEDRSQFARVVRGLGIDIG